MKWLILLVLVQADGRATQFEIPTSAVYVRSIEDCEQVANRLKEDYWRSHGLKVRSSRCVKY